MREETADQYWFFLHTARELTFRQSDGVTIKIIEPVHRPQRGLSPSATESGLSTRTTHHDVHVELADKLDLYRIGLLGETRVIGIGVFRDCLLIDFWVLDVSKLVLAVIVIHSDGSDRSWSVIGKGRHVEWSRSEVGDFAGGGEKRKGDKGFTECPGGSGFIFIVLAVIPRTHTGYHGVEALSSVVTLRGIFESTQHADLLDLLFECISSQSSERLSGVFSNLVRHSLDERGVRIMLPPRIAL